MAANFRNPLVACRDILCDCISDRDIQTQENMSWFALVAILLLVLTQSGT